MKRILLASFVSLLVGNHGQAQTTATNWTATDCNSTSHTLFNELDAGKVVVLVWVMPCAVCISDAKAGYDAVASFATSNPGKVAFYLSDDVGDAGCTTLNAWAANNGMMGATAFPNTGNAIDEASFGGPGMPHVVVMGGAVHKIYLNIPNGSNHFTEIRNAISSALSTTAVGPVITGSNASVTVYPNPATGSINIGYTLAQSELVKLEVLDIRGVVVQSAMELKPAGQQMIHLALDKSLSNGYYQLRLSTSGLAVSSGFTIFR
jgi:hypothetical protein